MRLCKECWPKLDVAFLVENTDSEYLCQVSEALNVWPLRIEAGDICDARRPRFYWCSFDVTTCLDIVEVKRTPRSWNLKMRQQGREPQRWLDPGSSFGPGLLPCFVQVVPRTSPPLLPAGLKSCSKQELDRWAAAEYCCPPYQFRDDCTILRSSGERSLASAREREILMGFPPGHTAAAVPSSQV